MWRVRVGVGGRRDDIGTNLFGGIKKKKSNSLMDKQLWLSCVIFHHNVAPTTHPLQPKEIFSHHQLSREEEAPKSFNFQNSRKSPQSSNSAPTALKTLFKRSLSSPPRPSLHTHNISFLRVVSARCTKARHVLLPRPPPLPSHPPSPPIPPPSHEGPRRHLRPFRVRSSQICDG